MFVGREAEISAIKEKHGTIGVRHKRVAFVGLAGVGLAISIRNPIEKITKRIAIQKNPDSH